MKSKFLILFAMLFLASTGFAQTSTETVYAKSETGATIGYQVVTDTIPAVSDSSQTVSVEALFEQTAPNPDALLTELEGVRSQLTETSSELSRSQAQTIACNEEFQALQEQNNTILENLAEVSDVLVESSPRDYTFGIGVGYFTTEVFDVTGQVYIGSSVVSASYIFDDATDLSFGIGVGQQIDNRFTVIAGATFNRVDEEFDNTSFGLNVQYRVFGDFNIAVGVDTDREVRVGVGYNF